jgi:cytidylate kinase
MIITLSRQLGSGGDTIAARVAAALGLYLVDRATIHQAAATAGVPEAILQQLTYDTQRSLAAEILSSLSGALPDATGRVGPPPNPLGGIFAPMLPPVSISLEEGVRTLGLVIKDIAAQGNVLFLGQGSQVWLRDYQGVCHVQVIAPFELRVARVAEREKLSLAAARRRVRSSDQARTDYLARYHNANWLDPLLYHFIINTGQTPLEVAVALIVNAAQAMT